jgi:4-diphosphocytidyl-2-C-methyl-D-erythritol kinase
MRAAEEFARLINEPLPRLHIHLEKRIPIGAGLGGGSSDAATMLQILRDWYFSTHGRDTHADAPLLDNAEIVKLAAKLGADVPFFLSGARMAQACGIGEKLQPMDVKLAASVLIVFDPAIQISTREAYAALQTGPSPRALDYIEFFKERSPIATWKERLGNDFEPEIFRRFPRLAELKHSLYAHGADFALMSGSGSALYGLFKHSKSARKAQQFFERQGTLTFLSK